MSSMKQLNQNIKRFSWFFLTKFNKSVRNKNLISFNNSYFGLRGFTAVNIIFFNAKDNLCIQTSYKTTPVLFCIRINSKIIIKNIKI